MFGSRFMPCHDCGASVDRDDPSAHVCDPDRLVDFHLFALRSDVERLEDSVTAYLDSPHRPVRGVAGPPRRGAGARLLTHGPRLARCASPPGT